MIIIIFSVINFGINAAYNIYKTTVHLHVEGVLYIFTLSSNIYKGFFAQN